MSDSESNPWITKASAQRFDNPWITIVENAVVHPNGEDGTYTVVHFKRKAVAVVPIDDDDHTWLVGQFRYAHDGYEWEIPEGGSDPGEDPMDCARRELREETGIIAESYEQILEMQLSNSVTDEVAFAFVARGLSHAESSPDASEELRIRRVPVEEAIAMAADGRIRDALSVATLLKLAHLRNTRTASRPR